MFRIFQMSILVLYHLFIGIVTANAQSIEEVQLWYTELSITVCDQKAAGTDSRITASLGGEAMILNLGVNDFKRSQTYSYALQASGVRTVGDITELRISNKGKDPLCIADIRLSINNPTAALRNDFTIFYVRPQRWISQKAGDSPDFVIGQRELRASSQWNLRSPRDGIADLQGTLSRNPLSRDQVERMIETFVGDAIATKKKIGWGDRKGERYVELNSTRTRNVALIDLDLGKRGKDRRRAAIDVDFSLVVSCNDTAGVLDISVTNFQVHAKGLGGGRVWEGKIRKKLRELGASLSRSISIGDGRLCAFINPRFDENGDLHLIGI